MRELFTYISSFRDLNQRCFLIAIFSRNHGSMIYILEWVKSFKFHLKLEFVSIIFIIFYVNVFVDTVRVLENVCVYVC